MNMKFYKINIKIQMENTIKLKIVVKILIKLKDYF